MIRCTVSVVRAVEPSVKTPYNSVTALAFHSGIPALSIESRAASGGTP